MSKIAIVIVTWNSEKYLPSLFASLRETAYPADRWQVFFVDNGSSDATLEMISRCGFGYHLQQNESNVGFARGNNQGVEAALEWGADFLYFLNADTEVTPKFLTRALDVFEDPSVGQVQSLMVREGGAMIQSWGNELMFLGFGYSGGDKEPLGTFDGKVREIGYASGAATMVRSSVWNVV